MSQYSEPGQFLDNLDQVSDNLDQVSDNLDQVLDSSDDLTIYETITSEFYKIGIFKKILGHSQYSVIHSGKIQIKNTVSKNSKNKSKKNVAIKKINLVGITNDDLEFANKEEIICRSLINHGCSNIVKIYDVTRTDSYLYIVMEILTGSTLSSILIKPLKKWRSRMRRKGLAAYLLFTSRCPSST